jgi:hypothetical protein
MCCDSDAPTPDPLIGQAARANAETAKEALEWYKGIYASSIAPMQEENQALSRRLIEGYLDNQDQQNEFANEQNAYYKKTFRPVEEQMVRDATEYDSDANVERRQGIAASAVNQQFSNAAGQATRLAGRYGLSSSSAMKGFASKQALAAAGAQTGAAFDTLDKGIALRAGAATFGRNMPNTAASYFGLSNQTGGMAMNTSTQAMQNAMAAGNFAGQGFNTAIQGNASAGNLMLGEFNGRMQGYAADQQAIGGFAQGIGTVAGMWLGKPPTPKG